MESEPPQDAEPEVDRHDRETGRQLALLTGAGAVLSGAMLLVDGLPCDMIATYSLACVGFSVATALAVTHPIAAIRLVSGRWGELARDRRLDGAPREIREIAEKRSEGVPVTAAAIEAAVPQKERRAKLGKRLMIAAAIMVALSLALGAIDHPLRDLGGLLMQVALVTGFVGLVVWYRTL